MSIKRHFHCTNIKNNKTMKGEGTMHTKIIPLTKIKKIDIVNIKGGMTASQVIAKYKPDVLINLALYDVNTGTNITFLEDENVKSGSYFSSDGIGIKGDKELVWCTKDIAFKDEKIRDYVSGSPVIVKNGKKVKEWGNKYSSYIDGSHKRSVIGFNKDNLIMVVSDGNITLDGMADHCIQNYKPTYMINCDGGGSCHLQDKSKVYSKSTRANASWLLVYLKPEPVTKTVKAKETTIHFKGQELNGLIIDGSTQAPIRKVAEMLGLTVDFIDGEVYLK